MANSSAYIPEPKERRKHRRVYLIPIYVFLALYLIALGSVWIFLLSPFFKINKIEVVGNSVVPESDIIDLLKSRILGRSFWKSVLGFDNFLIWPKAMAHPDLVFLPIVKSLALAKNYRDHVLTVTVEERTAFDIWCFHKAQTNADVAQASAEVNCWWFDNEGTVFKKAISSEGSLINTVHDYSGGTLGLNLKILPDEFVANALSVLKVLKESGLNVKEVLLADISLRELQVSTYDGPKIYFSLAFPADNLLQVISDFQSRGGFSARGGSAFGGKNFQYLDFRVENKLYYK